MNNMNNLNLPPEVAPPPQVPLSELILSLEQATLMAKQLPATTDPNHLLQIYSFLHQAHKNLTFFVSQTQTQFRSFPPPPDNSFSSATRPGVGAAEHDGDEPMEIGDDDDDYEAGAEGDSKATTIDKVEEKLRSCFIKNKRVKRPLSPSLVAEERRLIEDGYYDTGTKGYDPHETRMRALDLIYQFHG